MLVRLRGLLVLAVAGLVAALFQQQATATVEVLVAARALQPNTVLTDELLASREVHASVVRNSEGPALAFVEAHERERVLGWITGVPVPAHQPLLRSYLVDPRGRESVGPGVTARIKDRTKQLYPLPVPSANVAMAGQLNAGELADVWGFWVDAADGPGRAAGRERVARFLARQEIFAYDAKAKQLTVEVTREQAALLTFLAQGGGQVVVAPVRVDAPADAAPIALDARALRQFFDAAAAAAPPGLAAGPAAGVGAPAPGPESGRAAPAARP